MNFAGITQIEKRGIRNSSNYIEISNVLKGLITFGHVFNSPSGEIWSTERGGRGGERETGKTGRVTHNAVGRSDFASS